MSGTGAAFFGAANFYMKIRIIIPINTKNSLAILFSVSGDLAAAVGILLLVHLTLAHIGARYPAGDDFEKLTQIYLQRITPFARCESMAFRTEDSLFESLDRHQGRSPARLILLDSRGKQMSSEAFAAWLGTRRDEGTQRMVFAIGPASGWSDVARKRAQLVLSLGTFTLAHALARLVLAEQLYRAFTILAGHPYHTGH
jgi:23S rRNA (pseudouridine1915-N3)-methyltransferase